MIAIAPSSSQPQSTLLLSSLNALDSALLSLTTSLQTYSPSATQHATSLLAANESLAQNLEQVTRHTENRLQIEHLRSQAAYLEENFKSQLRLLAELRAEVLSHGIASVAASAAVGSGDGTKARNETSTRARAVEYKDVLAFARNITRYNAPRGFKTPSVLKAEAERAQTAQSAAAAATVAHDAVVEGNAKGLVVEVDGSTGTNITAAANGTTTTIAAGAAGQLTNTNGDTTMEKDLQNPGLRTLDETIKASLDPKASNPFLPWPNPDQIARSSLARYTGWAGAVALDQLEGVGPDAAALAEEEERRRRVQAEQDENERVRREAYAERRHAGAQQEKPKAFSGFDFDDDD